MSTSEKEGHLSRADPEKGRRPSSAETEKERCLSNADFLAYLSAPLAHVLPQDHLYTSAVISTSEKERCLSSADFLAYLNAPLAHVLPQNDVYEKEGRRTSADTEKARRLSTADTAFEADSHFVDWGGPNDAANPRNWSTAIRVGHVVIVSTIALIVNLGSTMFAPGADQMLEEFGETSTVIAQLAVTIYLLGFTVGPLFVAPLSELYGRLWIYHICNAVFLAFAIGCALATNMPMFIVFRFLSGCAGSAPLTIGGGTVADVMPQEKRGAAMAVFAMGPLLGPVIGPVIGGFLSQGAGWRWAFWLLAIMSGTISLLALAILRETNGRVLLRRKAAHLRRATGDAKLRSRTELDLTPAALLLRNVVRPAKLLLLSPIVLSLSVFCAFVFGLVFLLFTTFPAVFKQRYGFSSGVAGLAYLGLGIGMLVGLVLFGVMSDKVRGRMVTKAKAAAALLPAAAAAAAASGDDAAKPEYRLPLMVWFAPAMPVGFFWYGWSVEAQAHWMVPIVGTVFVGLGALFVIMPAQIYLVDAFDAEGAASALAANTVVRSLFGTFLPLAGPKMYDALGLGWGNSLLGFLALAFAPVPIVFYRYGQHIRTRWAVKL